MGQHRSVVCAGMPGSGFHNILLNKDTMSILLIYEPNHGYSLPFLAQNEVGPPGPDRGINDLRRKFNFTFDMYYFKSHSVNDAGKKITYSIIEVCSLPADPPESMVWIARSKACLLTIYPIGLKDRILECMDEVFSCKQLPGQPPWNQFGGRSGPIKWMKSKISFDGYNLLKTVETYKVMIDVALFRVLTSNGWLYLKCCRQESTFVNEASVASYLARLFPEVVVKPMAVHIDRRWMITADFGDSVTLSPSVEYRIHQSNAIAGLLVRLHLGTVGETVTHMESRGLPRCDLQWLLHKVGTVLTNPGVLQLISDVSYESFIPMYAESCKILQSYEVPLAVIHGDPALTNVVQPRGAQGPYMLHDWGEACIAHPLYGLARLELDILVQENPDLDERRLMGLFGRDVGTNEHLKNWTTLKPITELKAMMKHVYLAFLLHRVVVAFDRTESLQGQEHDHYRTGYLTLHLYRLYFFSGHFYADICAKKGKSSNPHQ